MVQVNNPAGRLYQILNDIRSRFSGDVRMNEVWRVVLEIHPNAGLAKVVLRVSQVMQLVEDSKRLIRQLPQLDQALYLEPFEAVDQAMSNFNLDETWERFHNRISDETLKSIRFCSDVFSREDADEVIEPSTLVGLQNEVNSLLQKILVVDLPDELRAIIVDSLEEIRQAILGFRVNGVMGLKIALDMSLGAAIRFRDEFGETVDEDTTRAEVVEGFRGILGKLDSLVSYGLKIKQLVAPITQLILPGHSE